jgi:hypothetical protein
MTFPLFHTAADDGHFDFTVLLNMHPLYCKVLERYVDKLIGW